MRHLIALLSLGVLILLAACGGSGTPPPSGGANQPAAKQELTVASGTDQFVIQINKDRLGMYPLNANICEPLVRMTKDFQVEPWLATKWEYRGNNTYRFTLRPGVTFHDGRPLNAEAVKYTLDRTAQLKLGYSFLAQGSTTVVDDMTVDVKPAQPNLRVLEQLVHPTYDIIAPGTDPTKQPVCTGAFKFQEYVPQDHLSVVRNDNYWGPKAKLQKITFRFIPDANTRVLALQSGQVDAIFDVDRATAAGLKGKADLKTVSAAPGAVYVIYMTDHGPAPYTRMSDPVLRKAVALSLDRKTLVDKVLDGQAQVVNTVNPPSVLGQYASQVTGVPYDPKQAAATLDAAGWKLGSDKIRVKDGQRLTLSMIAQPTSVDPTMAQYLQAQLAASGIDVKLDSLDLAANTSRVDTGQYDLDVELPNQNDANPAFLLALRWYSKSGSTTKSVPFVAAGPAYDNLVEQASTATDHGDVQKQAAAAMHLLVDQQVNAIPLAGVFRIYAMSNHVQGFVANPSATNQWWDTVWLTQ